MFKSISVDIKSDKELAIMRRAGALLAEVLEILMAEVRPGISTEDLDARAEKEIRQRKATPAFLGYRGFPKTLCASLNEEVVHGIPSAERILKDGDILSMDLGLIIRGFYADSAVTVPVGKISEEDRELLSVTQESLNKGIEQLKPDNRLGDVGAAIQNYAEPKGYGVVREFVGHGIGRALHEDPPVPNYGRAGTGLRLLPGMVLALEPMVNLGTADVRVLEDQWTAVTQDRKRSAHFEHTIAITKDGPEVLTQRRGVA